MPTKIEEARLLGDEHRKSLIDFFKHQTTLCTATIILMVTIVGNLFPQSVDSLTIGLITLGTVFLLGSLGCAFFGLAELNISFGELKKTTHVTFLVVATVILFVIGLISFIASFIPIFLNR